MTMDDCAYPIRFGELPPSFSQLVVLVFCTLTMNIYV